MDIVALPRGGGKTERALVWLAEDPERRVLISMTLDAERAARAQAARLGYHDLTLLNFETPLQRRPRGGVVQYGVDNADVILARYLGLDGAPALLTVTGGVV